MTPTIKDILDKVQAIPLRDVEKLLELIVERLVEHESRITKLENEVSK